MKIPEELRKRFRQLITGQQTLLFATASLANKPELSVAPFVYDVNGCFYIYVSELAVHTANLRSNPQASILFMGAENQAENPFARERVIFNCLVQEVSRDEPNYAIQIQALTLRFGATVTLLNSLPDFHLFSFIPQDDS